MEKIIIVVLFILGVILLLTKLIGEPQELTSEILQRMLLEYKEFGNYTTLDGKRSNDVDYLIDAKEKLKNISREKDVSTISSQDQPNEKCL